MTDTICLGITTYKKPKALRGILDSIPEFGNVEVIHISDDNNFETEDLVREYQQKYNEDLYPFPFAYSSGPNLGIAKAKNRNIKFFIEETECDFLVLSDDDFIYKKSNFDNTKLLDKFLEAHKETGFPHLMGYFASHKDPLSGNPHFNTFPVYAEDNHVIHSQGCQGICLFFTRESVKTVGYFDTMPGRYGYEHALYSSRINKLSGREPKDYIFLKNMHRYIECQGIPNQYEAKPQENAKTYEKRMQEIYNGVGLIVRNSGI
jgi:GT2 family glycosyltransferase